MGGLKSEPLGGIHMDDRKPQGEDPYAPESASLPRSQS
jgi:hypothetical protein